MRTLPVVIAYLFIACAPAPRDIQYGIDSCHSCMMTIVDERHAAQLITAKGKAYQFDAIECMLRHLHQSEPTEYAFILVSDYDTPGQLIDAQTATYLVSQSIPSPMGAFLSAFPTDERAASMQQEKGGQVYDWTSIQNVIK